MLVDTFQSYDDKAELYAFAVGGTTENPTVTFHYDRVIECEAHTDGTGRIYLHVPEADLLIEQRVTNVRDRNGRRLHPDGMEYHLTSMQAVRDVYGNVLHYRYTADRVRD